MLGARFEFTVLEDLQIDETKYDGSEPDQQETAEEIKPELRGITGSVRRHCRT